MTRFKFKKSATKSESQSTITEGVHSAAIVQVASIGLQRPFNKDDEPEEQLAVAFELETGELIAKRMKFSEHPYSNCFALFTAAFPDPDDDEGIALTNLLGKPLLIEVELRDEKWPRVTAIMPLEEGFDPIPHKTKLLAFDADEMDRDVYSELHRDIRTWISQRVRHS
jgi:hypothetical protein